MSVREITEIETFLHIEEFNIFEVPVTKTLLYRSAVITVWEESVADGRRWTGYEEGVLF